MWSERKEERTEVTNKKKRRLKINMRNLLKREMHVVENNEEKKANKELEGNGKMGCKRVREKWTRID